MIISPTGIQSGTKNLINQSRYMKAHFCPKKLGLLTRKVVFINYFNVPATLNTQKY